MGVPFEMSPQSGLQTIGGQASCFPLKVPSGRCTIDKIVIVQTDGVLVAFTAAFYNHEGACEGLEVSDSDVLGEPSVAALPSNVWRVTPDLAGTAGVLEYFSDTNGNGLGFTFVNQDKTTYESRIAAKARKIYLKITPAGSGAKAFAVALAGEMFGD